MVEQKLGIGPADEIPAYTQTGEREIRARNVAKRHLKALDDLQVELDCAGRREAIAALCEFYADNRRLVLGEVGPTEFQ